MRRTVRGKVTLVRLSLPLNALAPISTMPSGSSIWVSAVQCSNVFAGIFANAASH